VTIYFLKHRLRWAQLTPHISTEKIEISWAAPLLIDNDADQSQQPAKLVSDLRQDRFAGSSNEQGSRARSHLFSFRYFGLGLWMEIQKLDRRKVLAFASTFSRIAGSGRMRAISIAPTIVEKI
jgi:hypothetical protein